MSWDDVPLVVVGVANVSPIVGLSVRVIERRLADGTMQPAPMPRRSGERWRWSKTKLQQYVDGPLRPRLVRSA